MIRSAGKREPPCTAPCGPDARLQGRQRHARYARLEGFPAPFSGVLPDLSFARNLARETHSFCTRFGGLLRRRKLITTRRPFCSHLRQIRTSPFL